MKMEMGNGSWKMEDGDGDGVEVLELPLQMNTVVGWCSVIGVWPYIKGAVNANGDSRDRTM